MNASPGNSPTARPKVLHCISNLALGGAERVALDVIRLLQEEYRFELFAVRGVADGDVGLKLLQETRDLKVPVHMGLRIPMRYGGVISSAVCLARVMRHVLPDLIHLHTEIPEAAYAGAVTILPRFRHVPVVRTIHNAVYWDFWPGFGRWADRQMCRSYIAGVSRGALEGFTKLRQLSQAPSPPSEPILAYNGVTRRIQSSVVTKPTNGPLRIIFGGRLAYEKGVDLLPEILRLVRPPDAGAILSIFGSGKYKSLLRDLAANPPLGWTIELHDPIPNFAAHLNQFDLGIVPSRYEGLGLVAIESLLAGLPVVATAAPGLNEVFEADYPWLAQPGSVESFASALRDAFARRSEWRTIVAKARDFAERRFSPSLMATSYRNLYQLALAGTAIGPGLKSA